MISACSTWSESSVTFIDYPPALNDANYYFKKRNYERAESEVHRYLNSTNEVYWHGHAYLLLGEIREKSGREAEAVDAYKKAMGHSSGYHGAVTAQALYRLSWVYEREAKYDELLIVLLDLERALSQGDNFIKYVETPARLANTYYVLSQWDNALKQRARVSPEVMDANKEKATKPADLFQALLYKSFLGMKPVSTTPQKSGEILQLTQKELLEIGEMGDDTASRRAFSGIEIEYERYLERVLKLPKAANDVELAERNKAKLEELAQFIDSIEDLRASRRPPEVVVNQKSTLNFFRTLSVYKKSAKALVDKLEIGLQKAKKTKNTFEPPAEPRAPKKRPPAQNKAL